MDSWEAIVEKNDIDMMANILEYHAIREHEEQEYESEKLKALMSIVAVKPPI